MSIYLDYAATTPVLPEVADLVTHVLTNVYGNPSSLHAAGLEAERLLRQARDRVAKALSVDPREIVFTSGGTEANQLAMKGAAYAQRGRGRHVIVSAIEHPSVLAAADQLSAEGFTVTRLPVSRTGLVASDTLAAALQDDTILVSIMTVNNEIGTVQPIDDLVKVVKAKRPGILFHTDAVQAFGTLDVSPRRWGVDLLSVSGHKLYAPKGVGALYVRSGISLVPLLPGGQERGLRGGTENVPAIAAFGLAAEMAMQRRDAAVAHVAALRRRLLARLEAGDTGATVIGPAGASGMVAPHIINLSIPGVRGEVLVRALSDRGVYVSTGSACSSRRRGPSHVLTALGLPKEQLEGCLRVSVSTLTTETEIDEAAERLEATVTELRALVSR